MNARNEACFQDWPAGWLVVAFPHGFGLDPRFAAAIAAIANGSTLEANGSRIDDIGAVVDDPTLLGAVIRLFDASGEWEALCSNVGSFSLLGATPSVMSVVFDARSRAGLRTEFESWVNDNGVGFGETGRAFAIDQLLRLLRRP
ncbi:hypothetical protein [Brevundimonas sp.]|jgi:hypothetical protein|uniref:hypothetical protein n=1 Tax=Brevundimonas sp. TaxID=1871086 RepID=UPI002E0E54D0|nr:hypothetical protein [Brevundimonas sp.]